MSSAGAGRITRRAPDDSPAPLSAAQQRFWLFERFWPGTAVYNRPTILRLRGTLDRAALEGAITGVVERHEALRTVFREQSGAPAQLVRPAAECLEVSWRELAAGDDSEESRLREAIRDEVIRPFDLERSPVRAVVLRVSETDHVLVLTAHHIVFDGWSKGVLLAELSAHYEARLDRRVPDVPPLQIQVADHAAWEARAYTPERMSSDEAFWREALEPLPEPLGLVADFPRPVERSFRGGRCDAALPPETLTASSQLARRLRATPFMLHLAAYAALLHRYTGSTDLVIGCPIAGRTHVEMEPLIGCFINTLPIRIDIRGDPSFRELVDRVRRSALGALAHQALPFQTLVAMLRPDREANRPPLFQAMFNFRNLPPRRVAFRGLEVEEMDVDTGTSLVDLALDVHVAPNAARLSLEFDVEVVAESTAAGMLRHLACLTMGAIADPDAPISTLPLMGAEERRAVVFASSGAKVPLPENGIDGLIAERVASQPGAIAVEGHGDSITYAELLERADRLAAALQSRGIDAGAVVALALPRSVEMVIAMVGILRARCAYLPLDPAYPAERLAFMLTDAAPFAILTNRELASRISPSGATAVMMVDALERETPEPNEPALPRHDAPAYVMYTSGSTGVPKGVVVPHRAVLNHNLAVIDAFALRETDRVLQFASPSFDGSVEEVFPTLIAGATLVLRSETGHASPHGFLEELERERITVLDLPTAYWREWTAALPRDAQLPDGLRLVIVGGEEAIPNAHRRWRSLAGSRVRWLNTYGPTEATIVATIWDPERDPVEDRPARLPIGRPIHNVRAYVVDGSGALQPTGVPGELCIAGAGVARGYLRRPELDRKRFVVDPFDETGAAMYRTGDRARRRADGLLEYLGRLDGQIKVRGHRVEPGEVEAALRALPGVDEAVVVLRDERLVAYIGARAEQAPDEKMVRAALALRLPPYLVPDIIVRLAVLPRDGSGQVDGSALPAPRDSRAPSPRDASPGTGSERRMLSIWRELLGNDTLGVDSEFFASGGHSLLALRLAARIEREFGVRLAPTALFEHSTPAALAGRIVSNAGQPLLVPLQPRGRRLPFFCVHEFFGDVFMYRALARALGNDQPLFALQPPGLDGVEPPPTDIPALAARYIEAIRSVRPSGPYALGGLCAGGLIAQEMAQQLVAAGEDVAVLALFDANARSPGTPATLDDGPKGGITLRGLGRWARGASELSPAQWRTLLRIKVRFASARLRQLVRSDNGRASAWRVESLADAIGLSDSHRAVGRALREAMRRHVPRPYAGRMVLFRPRMQPRFNTGDPSRGWSRLARGNLTIITVPGNHLAMLHEPHVAVLARELAALLDTAEGGAATRR